MNSFYSRLYDSCFAEDNSYQKGNESHLEYVPQNQEPTALMLVCLDSIQSLQHSRLFSYQRIHVMTLSY